ncbi:MAG TPA: hypothetical protein VJM74_01020 [Nitrososphaeraceae archaeon]|jgi:hypothetical protein|nr:hypothetical protein [Nitrososphaeraceae archaeon]
MKEARFLKILIEEKGLVRLLKTIGTGRGYSTRELLTKLGAYGYGHKLLLKAHKRGLVSRKTLKNKVYNSLTEDGKKIVKLAKEIGV